MKTKFAACWRMLLSICLISCSTATAAGPVPETKPVFHRKPLLAGEFAMLPLGSVKPGGWLKRELQIQADGITGHMDEFYHLLTQNGWLGKKGPKFNSYQWAPYYLDGLVPLAHLLDSERLKDKAAKWIDWTLSNPHKDGWIGPAPEVCYRSWGMWYPTPMLKALVQHAEATGDKRVIPILQNFFKCYAKRMNPVNGKTLLENSDHEITVTYFEKGGGEGLEVLWEGPDIDRRRIPDASVKDLQYEYYEGSWEKLPEFDKLEVVDSGKAANFDIAPIYKKNKKGAKPDNFAIRFTGKIAIRENGWYTFYLVSDAGSRLSINGGKVVDNDGLHPMNRGGLRPSWASNRWGDAAYVAMWLYDRTGDESLVDLVKAMRANGRNWSESFTTFKGMDKPAKGWGHHQHGVNTAMGVKTPGISYLLTKDKYDLDAITKCFENLDRCHGTPVGIFTAEECLAGRGPDKGCELCLVIDEMFSIEVLLSVTGDWRLADRLEKITYNAWPATVGPKQWTHQYFQRVNQVVCEKKDRTYLFGPYSHFPCCTANLPQGWPKFAANSWMATPDGGLAAVVYAPSTVTSIVAGDKKVTVVEETEYPFDENIKFTVRTDSPVEFPLYVRIPGWADSAKITDPDGKTTSPKAGQYVKINRTWKNGDSIKVTLPMKLSLDKRRNNAVAVQRGPLVYSLKIGEDWRKVKDWPDFKAKTAQCADWAIYPTTPWNYALQIDPDDLEGSFKFEKVGIKDYVFDSKLAPVKLTVKGRRLPEWKLTDHNDKVPQRKLQQPNRAGLPPKSPVQSSQPLEDLTLIPYGAAKLRITVFPVLKK
ncbi:MAG: glycoside hydrolase family 127 protein [Phycisphaerae bacterium]|nr:glycoside hydrolase family 127 protein [Phycisphaerae bacterium]